MAGQGLQKIPLRIPEKWDAAWYARHIREVLALADTRNAIEGPGITITGQPGEQATVSTSEDLQNLLLQTFVLATPSGFLTHERVLAGEPGVIEIDDGGDNADITVGIADHGVNLGKLVELSGLGVLGNPVDGIGQVQNINPEAALAVLHSDAAGTSLVFDTIDHTYISDWVEAVQDVAGLMLVDSTSIDFSYDDTAGTATGSVITANPSGLIGMSAVNGTAATPLRSDGRHAIDPAIAPEWTGTHGWADNAEIQLGTGNDLRLYHDGTDSFITNGTNALSVSSATSILLTPNGANGYLAHMPSMPKSMLDTIAAGVGNFYTERLIRLIRSADPVYNAVAWGAALSGAPAAAVAATGLITFQGGGYHSASTSALYNAVQFRGVTSENWSSTARGAQMDFSVTPNGTAAQVISMRLANNGYLQLLLDSQELQLGASQDLRLLHDGTNSFIRNDTGNLVLNMAGTDRLTVSGAAITATLPYVAPAATTSIPSIRLPHGAAPSAPTNGDMWTTTAGLFVRINGATVGPLS